MPAKQKDMPTEKRVDLSMLRKRLAAEQYDFETTADVEPLADTVGQERALEALDDGLSMQINGFNIYASGQIGTGRNSTVRARVEAKAKKAATPSDWVYVNNFDLEEQPVVIKIPAGRGHELANDMEELIDQCQEEIPKAFESEEHAKNKTGTVQKLKEKQNEMLRKLDEKARRDLDHTVKATPQGLTALPISNGEPIPQEDFEKLDDSKKDDLMEKNGKLQQMIAETMSQAKRLQKEVKEKTRKQDREVALFAIGHLIDELKEKYQDAQAVVKYLDAVRENIIDNLDDFQEQQDQGQQLLGMQMPKGDKFLEYKVNVVVDHRETEGAPVIDERNPTYYNLLGQLEYRSQFGGMTTDFTMIKAGSVQKASGGFLILQALDVLRNPFVWQGLKRTLRTARARIENMWSDYQAVPAATLKPQSIPIDVKVILVGSPLIYQLLQYFDEDFPRLFKIKADFDTEMDMTDDHLAKYAAFVRSRCDEGQLPPFTKNAVARIAEEGARLTGHQRKLSARFLAIADLIAEAGHCATQDGGAEYVGGDHVKAAVEAYRRRSRLIQDKIQQAIEEDTILIETDASEVGQVNGLSVMDIGDYRFGRPARITCITSIGRGGVINIERESKMSGSIHDKGVLVMSGFVARSFGQDKPLALNASICFEQSYAGIDGDSASCAELYALLSSLAELPLRQDIAVTGSINQRGQVQPIGGVNEKIEGFYEVCKRKGLTGSQGVMIPARNIKHLMLNDEVLKAVEEGEFNIYAVDNVEEGIEILTGVEAGKTDDKGKYTKKSVYGIVDSRLREMAELLKEFEPSRNGQKDKNKNH